jgi:hypothetical protein
MPSLAAGEYRVLVFPSGPVTSSMQVGYN